MESLQIINVGKMWRVIQGEKVLGFAIDYPMALHKHRELNSRSTNENQSEGIANVVHD